MNVFLHLEHSLSGQRLLLRLLILCLLENDFWKTAHSNVFFYVLNFCPVIVQWWFRLKTHSSYVTYHKMISCVNMSSHVSTELIFSRKKNEKKKKKKKKKKKLWCNPVNIKLVSRFWTESKMKWFLSYLWINVGNINSEIRQKKSFHFWSSSKTRVTEILLAVRCRILWLY